MIQSFIFAKNVVEQFNEKKKRERERETLAVMDKVSSTNSCQKLEIERTTCIIIYISKTQFYLGFSKVPEYNVFVSVLGVHVLLPCNVCT